ncbi:Receptor expression-enhancing protein [Trichostrongylus colubriformis]|uniref:Receptor expression-enhancing protein n=1 Tax=Trichostrongylus colubriformis TaxID=6319 RepID=A0AAN8FIM3_TRICO
MSKAPASAASDAPPSSAAGGGGSPIEGLKKAHADLVAWCYKPHGAAADEQLKKLDASGVKREHIAYGVIAVMSLYLIGGEEAMFLSYVITFFYPASASVEAVRSKNSGEALNELQYWIPFGFFALIDSTAISSFPAWYFMKTVILVFLFLPQTRGSLLLFQKVIDPISRVIEGITKKK